MALVALLCCDPAIRDAREKQRAHPNFLIFLSAAVDVAANVLCMVGLYLIGSGLFQGMDMILQQSKTLTLNLKSWAGCVFCRDLICRAPLPHIPQA